MGTNVIQLADYLVPSYRRPRAVRQPTAASAAAPLPWSAMARARVARQCATACNDHDAPPIAAGKVRVARAADAPDTPDAGARLRISGRLIDVCAELERLAAIEAAGSSLPRRA